MLVKIIILAGNGQRNSSMLITQGTLAIKLPAFGANQSETDKVTSDEQAERNQSSIVFEQSHIQAKHYNVKQQQAPTEQSDFSEKLTLQTMMQKILDHRLGIDRERLDEIEKEMEDIINNPNLSDEEKKLMLDVLDEEKQGIIEKQAREFAAREKNAAGQQKIIQQVSQNEMQGELSQEQPTQQQNEMFLEALITDKYRGKKSSQE